MKVVQVASVLVLFAAFLMIFSCKDGPDLSSRATLLNGTPSDTIVLVEKAVLFFRPDTLQVQRIQAKVPDAEFRNTMQECAKSTEMVKLSLRKNWPTVRDVDNKGARYLLCTKNDKSRICIDMNASPELCALYAFDPAKDPQPIGLMNSEIEIYNYFNSK